MSSVLKKRRKKMRKKKHKKWLKRTKFKRRRG
ncbi:MAG: 30S ribosomal protein bS22 [Terriglobia bacterium]